MRTFACMKAFAMVFFILPQLFAAYPPRMEIFYNPKTFAVHHDDLAALVPSISDLSFDSIIKSENRIDGLALLENIEILWGSYHNQTLDVTVVAEEKKIVQKSGEISIGLDLSILSDNTHQYCLHNVQLECRSSSVIYNRTFRTSGNEQSIDVELAIEWEDLTLLDIENNDMYWQKLLSALNQSFKQKIGEIISQKLLDELKTWYKSEDLTRQDSIYFVPHSSLMIELRNQLKFLEITQNSLTFARKYFISSNSIPDPDASLWKPSFDPNSSEYQIAVGKSLVEHLIQYAFESDYFTYFFSNSDSLISGINQKTGIFKKIAFGVDSTSDNGKQASFVCQTEMEQTPSITFSDAENAIKVPQKLLCGIVMAPFTKQAAQKMIKFRVEMDISYGVSFNQDKHETVIKIQNVEKIDGLVIISPKQKVAGALEGILKDLIEESVPSLKGKLVQLGSGIDLPIQNAQVYVKSDHLLFIGHPLKRLIPDYPRTYFNEKKSQNT